MPVTLSERTRTVGMTMLFLGLVVSAAAALVPDIAGAATVAVTVTPPASKGVFANGATVAISVGPNASFVPHSRVAILECSDPGGAPAQLPTSISNCDENTVQADSVLVQPDGSFSDKSYTVYSLPNAVLGEQSNWQPVCDATHTCVLFVGENQNDFTQPKVFSQPFSVTASSAASVAPAAGGSSSTTSTTATKQATPPSAAVTLRPSTLAFTGSTDESVWLVLVLGSMFVGLGWVSRLVIRRARR